MPNQIPPPLPTQSVIADNQGRVTKPWIYWFQTLGQIFGFNQTIESDGTPLPQEIALNFSADFVVTDNPANGSTDVSLALFQSGTATAPYTGNDYSSVDVTFPTPFPVIPKVFVNPTNFPRSANAPMSCYATNITETGFTANLACSVPTGGGGATVDNAIGIDWMAIS